MCISLSKIVNPIVLSNVTGIQSGKTWSPVQVLLRPKYKRRLVAGEVPVHLLGIVEVPLSKAPNR